MRLNTLLLALAATLIIANSTLAQEQPAQVQPAQPAAAPASVPAVPARGSTMEGVKAKFGAPTQESAAVGKPPITRWDYPGYAVFFENDRVLHTVIAR
jgi:hypothetical protein